MPYYRVSRKPCRLSNLIISTVCPGETEYHRYGPQTPDTCDTGLNAPCSEPHDEACLCPPCQVEDEDHNCNRAADVCDFCVNDGDNKNVSYIPFCNNNQAGEGEPENFSSSLFLMKLHLSLV